MSAGHRSDTRSSSTPRRLGRWVLNTGIVLVIALCLAWLAPSVLGFSRYVITGGSMTGSIAKGSVAFEKPVPVEDLAVGDVITYLPPPDSGVANLVTHRIVSIEPAVGGGMLFTTKGDANAQVDPWKFQLLDPTQPVVEFSVPQVGWVFIALADRKVRMLVIGLPAALIALAALAQLAAAVRGSRRDEPGTDATRTAVPTSAIPAQRTEARARAAELV